MLTHMQALVTAAYAAVAAAVFAFAWSQNYNLAAALLVNWARDKLSFTKVATLLVLAWFDKVSGRRGLWQELEHLLNVVYFWGLSC